MKIKPIRRTIKATALCNPNPSYVSQVKAGANQRPYRAIKMDAAVPASDETEAPTMTIKTKLKQKASTTVAAIAPKGYAVAQFEFSSAEFPDQAAVEKWMNEGGYEDYAVVQTSKGFEVSNSGTTFEPASVAKIDAPVAGITVFVGKVIGSDTIIDVEPTVDDTGSVIGLETTTKADEEPVAEEAAEEPVAVIDPPARTRAAPADEPAEEEPAAPEPEQEEAERAAEGGAPQSEEVPEEPAQPVAPSVEGSEIERAATDAIETAKSAVEELRTKGVYEAAELGRIVNQLGWIVYDADYSGMSEDTVGKIKTAALALLDAFMQASTDAANDLTEVFRTAEERAARSASPEAEPQATPDITSAIAEEVARQMQPLSDRVTTAEAAAAEATARAEKAERALQEREEADASIGQTRKGAEEPAPEVSTSEVAKQRSAASVNILSSFGSRHARR